MASSRRAPRSVSLRVGATRHAVEAISLSGHRASLRGTFVAPEGTAVCVQLDWGGGRTTSLPSRVASVTSNAHDQHVADVDVCAVEGDWRSFLEYLGPVAVAS